MKTKISHMVRDFVESRSGGMCEAGLPKLCVSLADQMHHRKAKSQVGHNGSDNLLHVCFPCHRAITDRKPGTARYRTRSWQAIGTGEDEVSWQPENRGGERPSISVRHGPGASGTRLKRKSDSRYPIHVKSTGGHRSEFPDEQEAA